jgi:hypothetical protein
VLTFSGIDTPADYQTALASVDFTSKSDNPTDYGSDATRALIWTVSDGLLDSAPQTETVSVVGVNDPPMRYGVGRRAWRRSRCFAWARRAQRRASIKSRGRLCPPYRRRHGSRRPSSNSLMTGSSR